MGIFDGNNSNDDLDGLFGVADWGDEFKIDAPFGSVSFADTTLTVINSSPGFNGDEDLWSLTGKGDYESLMFVLKGGPSYSAYSMDVNVLFGGWDRFSMLKGNGDRGPELSHWSVYVSGNGDPTMASVPLPAAGIMLLMALGGLGAARLRKG